MAHIKSPCCLPQKCLQRQGNLVVTHCWPQLFDGAWGKGKPKQTLNSFRASTVHPVTGANSKTICTSVIPSRNFKGFCHVRPSPAGMLRHQQVALLHTLCCWSRSIAYFLKDFYQQAPVPQHRCLRKSRDNCIESVLPFHMYMGPESQLRLRLA